MDLFAWSNEAECSGRFSVVPGSTTEASVEYRYARLAQPSGSWVSGYLDTLGRDPSNTHADLGHEIDVGMRWTPSAFADIRIDYSVLVLGAGARDIVGAAELGLPRVGQFAMAQTSVRVP